MGPGEKMQWLTDNGWDPTTDFVLGSYTLHVSLGDKAKTFRGTFQEVADAAYRYARDGE